MEKCVNVVLRILLIAACIVAMIAGVYLFCVKTVNDYYAPADDDIFFSSMTVKDIFPMNDGRIVVCGTYLPGDSVYERPSVFFKSYDNNGDVDRIAGVTIDQGYAYSGVFCDGEILLLVANNTEGDVKTYGISPDFEVTQNETAEVDGTDMTGIVAGLAHSDVFIAKVRNGHNVQIKSHGRTLLETEFTEDVFIDNVYFAGNTFYLTGKVTVGENDFPYISGFSLSNVKKFETTVSEKFSDFYMDGFVFLADGKTYITGKMFNRQAFAELFEGQEISAEDLDAQGDRTVISERDYGAVLIANSYANDPWCTRFICPIDADNGKLGEVEKLLYDGPELGITEIFYSDAYKLETGRSKDNPDNKPVIASLVVKTAPTQTSESYLVNVYLLFSDMTTSSSANIIVPSDHYFYPGTASDGSLFCYTGIAGESGNVIMSMKRYSGTEAAAEMQRTLPVYKTVAGYINEKASPEIIAYAFVFLVLYTTARYRGTDNGARARETAGFKKMTILGK